MGGLVNRACIGNGYKNSKIFDLEPLYYVSFASPHLGITDSKKIYHTACKIVSKNKEICSELNLESEFLKSTTNVNSPYLKGLSAFKVRYLFCNIKNDGIVNYNTSSISFVDYNEFIQSDVKISKHILIVIPPYTENTVIIKDLLDSNLFEMYNNLNKLDWVRIPCNMDYPLGFLSHTKIYASNFLNSKLDGSDIVDYMIDLISKKN